jgi:peptide/nickel transport system permease protein
MQSLTLESATERSAPRSAVRRLPRLHVKAFTGGIIMLAFIAVGVLGPKLAPSDPNQQNLSSLLKPPEGISARNVLGTDNLGRDIFSRVIHGARISLLIAFAVVFVSGFIGVSLGALSGYMGGKTDFLIQKFVEVMWAFPPLLLGITIMAFLGQGLFNLILALVVQRWIPYCRIVRGQALSLREREFVVAAQCLGASRRQIITRHIIPNLLQTSLVIGTFAMASSIIAEASLSFLGVGVPPEIPTWGTMLADSRIYISTAWWLPLFPGLCIFITVLGINLLGDGLRDILDPRLKRTGIGK